MKRIVVVLLLAVGLIFALVQSGMSGKPDKTPRIDSEPIWKIIQSGTAKSVTWQDADNPRFAIYDSETPGDETDDVVLDKETGLVWERFPSAWTSDWNDACNACLAKDLCNRRGWRLPSVEELASLLDLSQSNPALPTDHPFGNLQAPYYWSSTTRNGDYSRAWVINLNTGSIVGSLEKTDTSQYHWCVRGGNGHNGI